MASAPTPVALVTGASSGIGRATAFHFAAASYRVFGTARRPAAVEPLAGVTFVALDVCDDPSVRAAVGRVLADAGHVDVLVNNAGIAVVGPLEETSARQAAALLDTNVLGALRVSQAVLPGMRGRGAGRIVNVSSAVGFVPAPFMGAYAASKHALEALSESMDHEVRPFGVRVLLVEPGFVRTNIAAAQETADTPPDAYAAALARFRRLLPAALFDRAVRKQFRLDEPGEAGGASPTLAPPGARAQAR